MAGRKVKVLLSGRAQRDLEDIYAHLAPHSRSALERVDTALFRALRRLETFPESGHWVKEFPGKRYREVLIFHYRVIYRYLKKPPCVRILTIHHGRRYLPTTLSLIS